MHTIYDMGNRNRQDAQRMSDQQTTIARLRVERDKLRAESELVKDQVLTLASHAARLRKVLEEAVELITNQFGVAYDVLAIDRWEAALADPSPQADAVRAVVEAAEVVQDKNGRWSAVSLMYDALNAYHAVTRGDGGAVPHLMSQEEIERKIVHYEQTFDMSSQEFLQKMKEGTAPDTFETMDWMILLRHRGESDDPARRAARGPGGDG